jgi:signal transduction histidine kinase
MRRWGDGTRGQEQACLTLLGVPCPGEDMRITAVAQALRAEKESLVERWLAEVCREGFSSAQDLSTAQLRDHVPELLERVFAAVEGDATPAGETEGQEHGHQRWGTGYDIAEVVRELALLRDVLLAAVEEYAGGRPGLTRDEEREVRRRIRAVIDRCVQASVARFHTDVLSVRRLLWEELETAHWQLKAANEEKDRFLATLSHELRNPLAPILTAVQLLEFSDVSDPRLRRAREVIERQVRHQTRLIDDLLDVSRIATGKLALRMEPHNLKVAVAYAAEAVLPGIDAKSQELRVELPDEPLPVEADLVRLEQIVTNLLTNANRYTVPGGTIWLTAERGDGEAIVRVRDTGIGIAPALLPRIFDLFTQAETARDRSRGGLGIGLALVKTLVELHGGVVEARSDGPGEGSEFVVRLPLLAAVAVRDETRLGATVPPRYRGQIAVVEDNPDSRAVLADLLEALGYPVVTAADGPTALRLSQEEHVEAFVIDIGLPGMDGYEVARRLRQQPDGGRMLLIALTGYGSPEDEERARAAGFDAFLTKPAPIDELEQLLSRIVVDRS